MCLHSEEKKSQKEHRACNVGEENIKSLHETCTLKLTFFQQNKFFIYKDWICGFEILDKPHKIVSLQNENSIFHFLHFKKLCTAQWNFQPFFLPSLLFGQLPHGYISELSFNPSGKATCRLVGASAPIGK